MIDFDTIGAAFENAQRTYGGAKFSEEEVVDLLARASTEGLRKLWCKAFHLPKRLVDAVMARPYPEPAQWGSRLEAAAAVKAGMAPSGRQTVGLSEDEIMEVAQHVLDAWSVQEPARRHRTPLRVFNSGAVGSVDALERMLLPWIKAASPGVPINLSSSEKLGRVKRWWDTAIQAVYDSPRLNGLTPGRMGCSLEWLAECEEGPDGRKWPTARLERAISGQYDKRREQA